MDPNMRRILPERKVYFITPGRLSMNVGCHTTMRDSVSPSHISGPAVGNPIDSACMRHAS